MPCRCRGCQIGGRIEEAVMLLVEHQDGTWSVDYTEEIDAGAEWLDAQDPRWFDRINLDSLQLESAHQCVLGQLAMTTFKDQIEANKLNSLWGYNAVLDTIEGTSGDDDEWATDHGFCLTQERVESTLGCDMTWGEPDHTFKYVWEQLTIQWGERIEKLRAEAGTAVVAP